MVTQGSLSIPSSTIPKAAWTKPQEVYLFVSLSMNRLVKSFTWATRSPKGFTLRATLSEVSRTKNRSTGQSGKKRGGRNGQVAPLHHLSNLSSLHICTQLPSQCLHPENHCHISTPRKTHKYAQMGEVAHFCFIIKCKLDRAHTQKTTLRRV